MTNHTARDIMTAHVFTLKPGQDALEAAHLFVEKKISGAPVVDAKGALVGVISEKDCMRLLYGRALTEEPDSTTVGDLMTKSVATVEPDTPVTEIARLFDEKPYRRFPVVQDGKVVGVVARRDVLRALEALLGKRRNPQQGSLITSHDKEKVGPAANVAMSQKVR